MKKVIVFLGCVMLLGVGSQSFAKSGGKIRKVNCPEQSLQATVDAARPGDIINVTGTCNESVVIPEEKQRITLDGQNELTTTLTVPNPTTDNVLRVRGKGILIQNFTITEGRYGVVVERGGSATINNNLIQNMTQSGILTNQSFAVITNNEITGNVGDGITLGESSSARIGFDVTTEPSGSPNNIHNNRGWGISAGRNSQARIAGNNISENTAGGIGVFSGSNADIAGNTIELNGGDGVNVEHNSNIFLGAAKPVNFLSAPNITRPGYFNGGYGIYCGTGAFASVHLGTTNQINGLDGQTRIFSTCISAILTP